MHFIRSTYFRAAKIVNAAKYAGLKAEDVQSGKVSRIPNISYVRIVNIYIIKIQNF